MNKEFIANLLLTSVVIAWYLKIWLHFRYLKAIDENLKARSLASFFISPENILGIFGIVAPIFIGREQSNHRGAKERKKVVGITFVLWFTLCLTFVFIYMNPPKKDKTEKVLYDFRNNK